MAVVTAGTADGPVADEAAAVARATGLQVAEFRDVGVAGLHRLLAVTGDIAAADVVIVVAGMEGALASVVGAWSASRSWPRPPRPGTAPPWTALPRCWP